MKKRACAAGHDMTLARQEPLSLIVERNQYEIYTAAQCWQAGVGALLLQPLQFASQVASNDRTAGNFCHQILNEIKDLVRLRLKMRLRELLHKKKEIGDNTLD